jgi:hypothetical protein
LTVLPVIGSDGAPSISAGRAVTKAASYTGHYLKQVLKRRGGAKSASGERAAETQAAE